MEQSSDKKSSAGSTSEKDKISVVNPDPLRCRESAGDLSSVEIEKTSEKTKTESNSQVSGKSAEDHQDWYLDEREILDDLEIDDAIFDDSFLISNNLKLKTRFKEYLREKSKDSAVLSRIRVE